MAGPIKDRPQPSHTTHTFNMNNVSKLFFATKVYKHYRSFSLSAPNSHFLSGVTRVKPYLYSFSPLGTPQTTIKPSQNRTNDKNDDKKEMEKCK